MTMFTRSGVAPDFCARALSRGNFRPLPSALPAIALMRSIHTAVGCFATVCIFAASDESLCRVAALSTDAAHEGFTYCWAPEYGLSTWDSAALAPVAEKVSGTAT